MKAAVAALLGAAVVFSAVFWGLGQRTPSESAPPGVELTGKAPALAAPATEKPEPEKRKPRRQRRNERNGRNIREVPRRVERVAVGRLDQPGIRLALGGPAPRNGRPPRTGPGTPEPPPDGPRKSPPPPPPPPTQDRDGVRVPDLVGLNKDGAKERLERRGLVVGDVRQRDSCRRQDRVLRQAIEAGTFVNEGTEVNFTIASGHAPGDNSGPGSTDSGSGSSNSGEGSDSSGSGSGDPC